MTKTHTQWRRRCATTGIVLASAAAIAVNPIEAPSQPDIRTVMMNVQPTAAVVDLATKPSGVTDLFGRALVPGDVVQQDSIDSLLELLNAIIDNTIESATQILEALVDVVISVPLVLLESIDDALAVVGDDPVEALQILLLSPIAAVEALGNSIIALAQAITQAILQPLQNIANAINGGGTTRRPAVSAVAEKLPELPKLSKLSNRSESRPGLIRSLREGDVNFQDRVNRDHVGLRDGLKRNNTLREKSFDGHVVKAIQAKVNVGKKDTSDTSRRGGLAQRRAS